MKKIATFLLITALSCSQAFAEENAAAPAEQAPVSAQSASAVKITLPEVNRKNCADQELLARILTELNKPEAVKLYSKDELQEIVSFSDKCLAILQN